MMNEKETASKRTRVCETAAMYRRLWLIESFVSHQRTARLRRPSVWQYGEALIAGGALLAIGVPAVLALDGHVIDLNLRVPQAVQLARGNQSLLALHTALTRRGVAPTTR